MKTRTTPKVIAEIRAEMARQAVTQTALASKVHMTLPALRRRLSGEAPLLVAELLDIADSLEVPPARFLDGHKTGPGRASGRGPTPSPSAERNG